jgi:hypothetical protein
MQTRPAHEFEGDFETHVTVRCAESELSGLGEWAAARPGVKLTHIMLGRGRVPSQPMLTVTGSGTLADQHVAARDLAAQLTASGFVPMRVKIETSPWATGVPHDDSQAASLGPAFYFEHHIKLLLTPGVDWQALAQIAIPHGAHVSWNARRVRESGHQERFVTQRCHGVGLPEAGHALTKLCTALREGGHELVSTEREFVVYDSDASIDDGWIEQGMAVVAQ